MQKNKIIYRTATGVLCLMMMFSGYAYFMNPALKQGFAHLGFPDYFRLELAVFKIAGAIVLAMPRIPGNVREWAYAGFGITFISAFIAHLSSGDAAAITLGPLFFFSLLMLSYVYYKRLPRAVMGE